MSPIRTFVRDDIPQVADLHRRVFGVGGNARQPISPALLQSYATYFEEIFFRNPWYDEALPSLVCQGTTGKITGFLGRIPRRMSFKGRLIIVSVCSQFIIEPDGRSGLAGVQLLKTHFAGPQDLSLTDEANSISRKLWEGLGGDTALLLSIQWTRLLRPSRYAVWLAERAGLLPRLSWLFRPTCNLLDTIAARKLPRRFRPPVPEVFAEDLKREAFLNCLSEYSGTRALWPDYDDHSLKWLLGVLDRKKQLGTLRQLIVRGAGQKLLGWYVYYLNPGNISTVVQIVAWKETFGDVVDHLFYDAWQRGSVAISGQVDPNFIQELSDRYCLFSCGKPWVLIHSSDPVLIEAIHHGNALLSKLEGELCVRFEY